MSSSVPPKSRAPRSNFYYSFLFLEKPKRRAVLTVYDFCHLADAISDGTEPAAVKKDRLAALREELDRCYQDRASHPVLQALADPIRRFNIPQRHFSELLSGVEMDLSISRYSTFDDLYRYCYRVASTVGLICLSIFGLSEKRHHDYAESLGVAFQLTNILRDLKEDGRRGRIYLPLEDLRRFGYAEQELLTETYNDRFMDLMRFEAARARIFYRRAGLLIQPQDRRPLCAAEIMSAIYLKLLDRVEANRYDVFRRPIRLSSPLKLLIATRTFLSTRLNRGARS
jgi:phytoene synthase